MVDYIPSDTFYDFEYDLFPALLNQGAKMYGYLAKDYFMDIGTIENYHLAQRDLLAGESSPKRAFSTR